MQAVILPQANQAVVMDYEDEIRGDLTLHWIQNAQEALSIL